MHAVRFVHFFQLQYILWSADKHTPSKRKKIVLFSTHATCFDHYWLSSGCKGRKYFRLKNI